MDGPANWTRPDDIRAQLERLWSSGRLLTAGLNGESLFPFTVMFKKPGTADLARRFNEVRDWIRELENGSRSRIGFGYEIEWLARNHRELGRQNVPARVVVPTEADALHLLGKSAQAQSFRRLMEMSLGAFPGMESWFARRPFIALEHADDWNRILDVVTWFCSHRGSGLYLRQVEIAGTDTKFIEERKGLFSELLDAVGTSEAVEAREDNFEQRFGLRPKPPLVRFRFLDQQLYIAGLSDLAIPGADFARLAPAVNTVFITENDINGLAFPDVPASLVIFGLGYGLERLSQATWLADKTLYYWGDTDTHGFAMLNRLRAVFPGVKSFLMDRETLLAHRTSWVREDEPYAGALERLTSDELSVFDDLRHDRFGPRVRLEQERISFGWIRLALDGLHLGS